MALNHLPNFLQAMQLGYFHLFAIVRYELVFENLEFRFFYFLIAEGGLTLRLIADFGEFFSVDGN